MTDTDHILSKLKPGVFNMNSSQAVAEYRYGAPSWFFEKTLPLSFVGGPYTELLYPKLLSDPVLSDVACRLDERLAIQGNVLCKPSSVPQWHPYDLGKECFAVFHEPMDTIIDILRFKVTDGIEVCGMKGLWIEVLSISDFDLEKLDGPIRHHFTATNYPLLSAFNETPAAMFVDVDTLLEDVTGDLSHHLMNLSSLGSIVCNPDTFKDPFAS